MSCGCPNCLEPKTVFGRNGEIGAATPYADGTNLFQRICFSPPFLTPGQNSVNCIETYATQSGCVYDAECGQNSICRNSVCTPIAAPEKKPQSPRASEPRRRYVGPADIFPQNPQAIDSFAIGDKRLSRYIPAEFASRPEMFVQATCPTGGGLLLTECAGRGGSKSLVCPFFPGHPKERNCANSLRSLPTCDMRRGLLTEDEYWACKDRENCFQYDIALPNGAIHPIGYKVTPQCIAYAAESFKTCAQDCSPIDRSYF